MWVNGSFEDEENSSNENFKWETFAQGLKSVIHDPRIKNSLQTVLKL